MFKGTAKRLNYADFGTNLKDTPQNIVVIGPTGMGGGCFNTENSLPISCVDLLKLDTSLIPAAGIQGIGSINNNTDVSMMTYGPEQEYFKCYNPSKSNCKSNPYYDESCPPVECCPSTGDQQAQTLVAAPGSPGEVICKDFSNNFFWSR